MRHFYIPEIKDQVWETALNKAKGIEKFPVQLQRYALSVLNDVDATTVTSPRLAWMIIWSRVFSAVEGIRTSLYCDSLYTLRLLDRASFETMITIMVIMQTDDSDTKPARRDLPDSIRLLNAYCAWCLWQDYRVYQDLLDKEHMDKVWDDTPMKDLLSNVNDVETFERFFGLIDIDEPEEIDSKRRRQESNARSAMLRIDQLLRSPDLEEWTSKLAGDKHIKSYFRLIGKSHMRNAMNEVGLDYIYFAYQMGSMLSHGTSVESFLGINADVCYVKALHGEEQTLEPVGALCNSCLSMLNMLGLLKKDLWNE